MIWRVIDKLLQKKVIYDRHDRDVYMVRYYLFSTRWIPDWPYIRHLNIRIMLHKICKSDEDCLHDHPWNWFGSIILSSGYWERIFAEYGHLASPINGLVKDSGTFYLDSLWKPWTVRFRDGKMQHRLELRPDRTTNIEIPCWSLFITGIVVREWGFWPNRTTKIQWEEYLQHKRAQEIPN